MTDKNEINQAISLLIKVFDDLKVVVPEKVDNHIINNALKVIIS